MSAGERIDITYLSGPDIAALAPSDATILDAVEEGLRAQGRGEAVIEPRVHLRPDPAVDGHFNVLRGSLPGSAWPASRSSATSSRTIASACRRRWRC